MGSFELIRKKNLYEDIVAQVIKKVNEGYFAPGEQLPGERDLALQLGVNRNSLREALRVLEFMRVLEKRAGEGVFVRDPAREVSLEAVIQRMLLEDGLDYDSVQDTYEAILIVEIHLAKMAARRTDASAGARLAALMVRMEGALEDAITFTALDKEFHLTVGQLGHSSVLFSILSTMWQVMNKYAEVLHRSRERRLLCLEGHARIVAAIREQRDEEAGREMERHLKGGLRAILDKSSPAREDH